MYTYIDELFFRSLYNIPIYIYLVNFVPTLYLIIKYRIQVLKKKINHKLFTTCYVFYIINTYNIKVLILEVGEILRAYTHHYSLNCNI